MPYNEPYHKKNEDLDPDPASRNGFIWCQYGIGEYANAARKILGFVRLDANSDVGQNFQIRQLNLEIPSYWVIGRNFGATENFSHVGKNTIQIIQKGIDSFISLKTR